MSTQAVDQHWDISPKMRYALDNMVARGSQDIVVSWQNTPRLVASGTAQALVDRGLARYTHTFEDVARGLSARIALTDLGRQVAAGDAPHA